MNDHNLVPQAHELTPEENRLGGINSGISRREKKRALELARDILSMPVSEGALTDVNDLSSLDNISDVTTDVLTSILAKLSKKALNGDVRACQTLLTISGDYTTRQEARITLDEDVYDDNHTEYIMHLDILGDDPRYEVQYFDKDYNIAKVIYGDEAKRLVDKATDRWRKGQGKTIQIKMHAVRVFDGENVIIHSFDGEEDKVIPVDEYYPPEENE